MQFYPPGTRIAGRYEVAGRPLMGGMGIVYLCFDHQEQRPVALKTFKPEYLPNRDARDRFLEEGDAWVRLGKHPHIVRCYEVFLDSPRPEVYLALELVAKEEGRRDASLRSWLIPGRPLPVEQALLMPCRSPAAWRTPRHHPRLRPPRPQAGERAGGRGSAEQRGDQPRAGDRFRAGTRAAGRTDDGGAGRERDNDEARSLDADGGPPRHGGVYGPGAVGRSERDGPGRYLRLWLHPGRDGHRTHAGVRRATRKSWAGAQAGSAGRGTGAPAPLRELLGCCLATEPGQALRRLGCGGDSAGCGLSCGHGSGGARAGGGRRVEPGRAGGGRLVVS